MSITGLTAGSHVTRQAIAKHLRVLEDVGLAWSTRCGRERVWQLNQRRLKDARRYLDLIFAQIEGVQGQHETRGTNSTPGANVRSVLEAIMPLVTVFNLGRHDQLPVIERALKDALVSMPELKINADEIDLVPVLHPDGFHGAVTRINVDLWERHERTKEALQELATRVANAFRMVAGSERQVKVVIRPYDVDKSGWVSF